MTHAQAVETNSAERYLLDEMSELERHAYENHYFSCLECAEDVRAAALMRDGAKAGLLGSPTVDSVRSFADGKRLHPKSGWRPSIVLPWAVAATLLLAMGYQSSTLVRAPQQQLEPQALVPVTLRPASRGAEPVVPLLREAAAVTLAFEVSAGQTDELVYDLHTLDNKTVASGRMPVREPGAPLLLLLPVWTLRPGEHYILSLRNATNGNLIDEFRFGVAAQ